MIACARRGMRLRGRADLKRLPPLHQTNPIRPGLPVPAHPQGGCPEATLPPARPHASFLPELASFRTPAGRRRAASVGSRRHDWVRFPTLSKAPFLSYLLPRSTLSQHFCRRRIGFVYAMDTGLERWRTLPTGQLASFRMAPHHPGTKPRPGRLLPKLGSVSVVSVSSWYMHDASPSIARSRESLARGRPPSIL